SMGQADEALRVLREALAIAEAPETKLLFVQCVRGLPVLPDTGDFRALLMRALSEPWGRANDLAGPAARLVKQDDAVAACLSRAMQAWPQRRPARELSGPSGLAAISHHDVLRRLMDVASICDIELERLLTAIRFAILATVSVDDGAPGEGDDATGEEDVLGL